LQHDYKTSRNRSLLKIFKKQNAFGILVMHW
jgi:hypothetical protein